MATVYIEKRKGKKWISYRLLYKDPATFKNHYYKTFRKFKEALKEAAMLRGILDHGQAPITTNKKVRYKTFQEVGEELIGIWAEKLNESKLSQVTYDGYIARLKNLYKTFGKRFVSTFSEKEIREFRKAQAEEWSASTSNRNLFILKQIFGHSVQLGVIRSSPTKDIPYLNEDAHKRNTFLMPDEIHRILIASQKTRAKFYLPALILLGVEHGTSKQEALSLKWENVNFDFNGRGLIRIYRSKTKKRADLFFNGKNSGCVAWLERSPQ